MAGVPAWCAWQLNGGFWTWFILALIFAIPILMSFWTIASSMSPRVNEKARYPGAPVEHYLTFKNKSDQLKYRGKNRIPMETFHEMYFNGDVEFNGDCLEVMEYRHDWANFKFTSSLFKHFLFGFIPEMLLHTRSQGQNPPNDMSIFVVKQFLTHF